MFKLKYGEAEVSSFGVETAMTTEYGNVYTV